MSRSAFLSMAGTHDEARSDAVAGEAGSSLDEFLERLWRMRAAREFRTRTPSIHQSAPPPPAVPRCAAARLGGKLDAHIHTHSEGRSALHTVSLMDIFDEKRKPREKKKERK